MKGGPLTLHLWDGWQQLGEFDGAREVSVAPGLGENRPGGFVETTGDHQGSTKVGAGTEPIFDPFGNLVSGSLDTTLGFQGQEWRPESGLYYMRNRWYDPATQRWLSRDPIIGASLSTYDFVLGDPIRLRDPFGLQEAPPEPFLPPEAGEGADDETTPGGARRRPRTDEEAFYDESMEKADFLREELGSLWRRLANALRWRSSGCEQEAEPGIPTTKTVARHEATRPFQRSPLLLREIMAGGEGKPDPGGVPGARRWDVPGSNNGTEGTSELVVDSSGQVLHWNFVRN